MVRAQVDYHGNTTKCFTILVPTGSLVGANKAGSLCAPEKTVNRVSPSLLPETQFQSIIQSKLGDIRSLSIVKNTA